MKKAEKEQQRLAEAEASARLKERVESLDKELSSTRELAESLREENTGLRSKLAASAERTIAQESRLEGTETGNRAYSEEDDP